MEDLTKELHPHAPAEPTQTLESTHHRFYNTRLWRLIRGETETGTGVNGRTCADCRGVERENQNLIDPPTNDGSMLVGLTNVLEEFLIELRSYCLGEANLPERMRTLRFTRSGLITAMFARNPSGAGKKCGHLKARRTSPRRLRLRTEDHRHGA